jgi:hypothetical protein
MALYSDSIIQGLKSSADISGALTQARVELLTLLDLQWLNNFEVIFYPSSFSALSTIESTLDNTVLSLHLQEISGISFPTLNYEDVNGIKHITGIETPDNITMTFIENDMGTVRIFVQLWFDSIYTPTSPFSQLSALGNTLVNTEGKNYYYLFKNNQTASKKNAVIILKGTSGQPSTGGWIKLEGLKIISASGFDIGQNSDEPMIISCSLSVDTVKLITPLSF